jgi:PKD repeat protein
LRCTIYGQLVSTIGSAGAAIALDGADNLYVFNPNSFDNYLSITKYSSTKPYITSMLLEGYNPSEYMYIKGLWIDKAGNIYTLDLKAKRIIKYSSNGTFLTVIGDPDPSYGELKIQTSGNSIPKPVVDSTGGIFVINAFNDAVVKYAPRPVVLIHGLRSDGKVWDGLEGELKKNGIQSWNFEYNTANDPRDTAQKLDAFITEKRRTYLPGGYSGKIDIVCHSMGSIVSRWWMEPLGHGNEVRQWIGIAPAHGGSAFADLADTDTGGPTWARYGNMWNCIKLTLVWVAGRDSIPQLRTDSPTVRYLKTDVLSSSTKYHVIAGWNPSYSNLFGSFLLSLTRAKASDGSYYMTTRGDMIVAQAQSYRQGMSFESFPNRDDQVGGGNDEPANQFDHTHIHHSKAVIQRTIEYLQNSSIQRKDYIPIDFASPDTLSMEYDLIKSGRGTITSMSNEIVADFTFPSGSTPNSVLLVSLDSTEGIVSVELTDPKGEIYTSTTSTGTAWSMSDSNHKLFTITSPTTGQWSAKIKPVSMSSQAISYNLTVFRSGLNSTIGNTSPITTPTPTVVVIPGGNNPPRDLNNDGKIEDVNGNGRKDFADITLYFSQMTWIGANEPLAAFDYNGNGRIDFADVTWLFQHL